MEENTKNKTEAKEELPNIFEELPEDAQLILHELPPKEKVAKVLVKHIPITLQPSFLHISKAVLLSP